MTRNSTQKYLDKFDTQCVLAGVLIGLGDVAYVTCESHILGSFLFSLGLLSIIIKGYPLYTGRVGNLSNSKDIFAQDGLFPMLIGNLFGIALICCLINFSHLDLSTVDNIITVKASQTWYSALILSWGCGAMMYLAVNGWSKTSNPIMVIIPIMFFILCGFEHCIADFGYYSMWMTESLIKSSHPDIHKALPYLGNFFIMIFGNGLGSLTFSKN